MIVSAHLGHWYVQLAFAVPALVIIGYMSRDSKKRDTERRMHDDERLAALAELLSTLIAAPAPAARRGRACRRRGRSRRGPSPGPS